MENSGWMPKVLDIVAPSYDFVETITMENISGFLSLVEEINVKFSNERDYMVFAEMNVVNALMKLFKAGKLSTKSISIKARYDHHVTSLLRKLSDVCGRLYRRDRLLFPHLASQERENTCSGLKNITVSTQASKYQPSPSDWGVIMFQDRIESITLKVCFPTNFPFLLSHLLTTRPSLRLIDLAGCWNDYNSLQLLVSTFLFASTNHPQTLVIRELRKPPGAFLCAKSQQEQGIIKLPVKVRGPCRSGEHKTLCLPFISSGPCSLTWLLSLPKLSLKSLNLTVRDYVSHLNSIHLIFKSHPRPFHFDCTIFVSCESQFPSQARSPITTQLLTCPPVKDVCFIVENDVE